MPWLLGAFAYFVTFVFIGQSTRNPVEVTPTTQEAKITPIQCYDEKHGIFVYYGEEIPK